MCRLYRDSGILNLLYNLKQRFICYMHYRNVKHDAL